MKSLKFIFKLIVIAIAIYILYQLPIFTKYKGNFKASVLDKVDNVTTEYNRIKGKVVETKKKVNETKDAVVDISNKVKETTKAAGEALDTVNKTVDSLNKVLGGKEEEKTDASETTKKKETDEIKPD